jgi:hypothetical protein
LFVGGGGAVPGQGWARSDAAPYGVPEERTAGPGSNGMDAPTRNGIKCAKVEVSSTT